MTATPEQPWLGRTDADRTARFDAYARRASPWMLVLALAFLAVWSVRVIAHGSLSTEVSRALFGIQGVIWVVFVADIVARVALHRRRWHYLASHPFDVLAIAIPAVRPLKILAVFTSGTMLASRKGAVRSTQAVLVSLALLLWMGSISILEAERGQPGAQIESFGDSLWWSIVTMTTVGYGDFAPITVQGRLIATVLMLLGIALIGVVTATVAAWFVSLTQVEEDARGDVNTSELLARISSLEAKLDRIAARDDDGASGLPHLSPKPMRLGDDSP